MKVLLCSSDRDLLEAVGLILEVQWPDTDAINVADVASCVAAIETHHPELVMVDADLPNAKVQSLCRDIRSVNDVPLIVMGNGSRDVHVALALDAGADDYIVKPFSTLELLARLRAVLRRARAAEAVALPGGRFAAGGLVVDFASREVTVDGTSVNLTHSEFELLAILAKNAGHVVSRRSLLGALASPDALEQARPLRMHMVNLRVKLRDSASSPRFIATVRRVGYRLLVTREQPARPKVIPPALSSVVR